MLLLGRFMIEQCRLNTCTERLYTEITVTAGSFYNYSYYSFHWTADCPQLWEEGVLCGENKTPVLTRHLSHLQLHRFNCLDVPADCWTVGRVMNTLQREKVNFFGLHRWRCFMFSFLAVLSWKGKTGPHGAAWCACWILVWCKDGVLKCLEHGFQTSNPWTTFGPWTTHVWPTIKCR